MNCKEPENLLYRVFFLISILLAMRVGERYHLKIEQFKFDDYGLKLFRYTSKNNQRGLHNGNANIINIPADSELYSDVKLYFSKRPICEENNFYLQLNLNWTETGFWYKSNHVGKNKLSNFMQDIGQRTQIDISFDALSNHSGHKTAAQCLQDNNISEQAIMQLTEHKSVEGVRAYKKINEEQKSYTMNTLINITDNSKNKLKHPLQEISFNSLNNNSQTPIFSNSTFSNVILILKSNNFSQLCKSM
ncbi:7048_t:CDS:1 [Diversispora eburnea]|uniref:7048_t:CDS:1 n=1 Tax=Diversispora eburnea TaxID=1213867 RepID=A0A9N8ZK18_9GLOM|nr:7048_t:CDS:1 [Diversispora eburnea]